LRFEGGLEIGVILAEAVGVGIGFESTGFGNIGVEDIVENIDFANIDFGNTDSEIEFEGEFFVGDFVDTPEEDRVAGMNLRLLCVS
jgi:hypothetical protein